MKLKTKEATDKVKPHRITDSEVGLDAICPVTKDAVHVTRDTPALEYKGEVYYFCCNDCPPKFRKNPEKYAGR
ncbi:MAG: YHS domain-containing protein [Candidatus Brocadiia bacterium]